MGRKIEKIKTHFRENKKVYLAFTGGVAVCFVANAVRSPNMIGAQNAVIQPLSWKPTATQTIDVHIEALGDPGNIIQDTTTGTIYASQNQAAKALGLNAGRISDHINGRTPHVNGHTFTKLGKAQVAE